jgi:hypothetical protein
MTIEAIVNVARRAEDGLADIRIRTEAGQEYQLDLPYRSLYRRCGLPNALALDLLITASLCYIVDKGVARSVATDNWTRDLEITIPVSDSQLWTGVAEELAETLAFLTGDSWHFTFSQIAGPIFDGSAIPIPTISSVQAVSLFSGGLDSLAGAIDLLNSDAGHILFMGHYDSSGRKVQSFLESALNRRYPNRCDIEHVRVAHRPDQAIENTLRLRSFLFIAIGLYGAQAFGPRTPLYMFENGLIALNMPLTPSRRGSCSTRTAHPYYLHCLRAVLGNLGVQNPIITPYSLKTKGECLSECQNQDTLRQLANTSVSCSHASRKQDWVRKNAANCGYCIPCIFRRAALSKVGLDNGSLYGIDVLAGELNPTDEIESANDLRAVVDFLRGPLSPTALRKAIISTALFPDLDAHAEMASRGFHEVKGWLEGAGRSAQKFVN